MLKDLPQNHFPTKNAKRQIFQVIFQILHMIDKLAATMLIEDTDEICHGGTEKELHPATNNQMQLVYRLYGIRFGSGFEHWPGLAYTWHTLGMMLNMDICSDSETVIDDSDCGMNSRAVSQPLRYRKSKELIDLEVNLKSVFRRFQGLTL